MSIQARCPVCGEPLAIVDGERGSGPLTCACCRSRLVVVETPGTGPVLEKAETSDEDWGE